MQGWLVKLAFLLTSGARMVCSAIFLVVWGCKVRHRRRHRFCAKQAPEGDFVIVLSTTLGTGRGHLPSQVCARRVWVTLHSHCRKFLGKFGQNLASIVAGRTYFVRRGHAFSLAVVGIFARLDGWSRPGPCPGFGAGPVLQSSGAGALKWGPCGRVLWCRHQQSEPKTGASLAGRSLAQLPAIFIF